MKKAIDYFTKAGRSLRPSPLRPPHHWCNMQHPACHATCRESWATTGAGNVQQAACEAHHPTRDDWRRYNHAIRIAKDNQMDNELMNLALQVGPVRMHCSRTHKHAHAHCTARTRDALHSIVAPVR